MRKACKKTFKKKEETATVLTFTIPTWDKTHPSLLPAIKTQPRESPKPLKHFASSTSQKR